MRFREVLDLKDKYKRWIKEGLDKLYRDDFIYEITEEHKRGDIYPEEHNYTVTRDASDWMDPNMLLRLLEALYDEYNKVLDMLFKVNKERKIDLELDADIYLNYAGALKCLAQLKNMKEKVTYETQTGYKVNEEGKQVSYVYQIRKTLIPDFDQNQITAMYDELFQKYIGKRYVGKVVEREEVPFESVFSVFDSLEEVYCIFEKQIQAKECQESV